MNNRTIELLTANLEFVAPGLPLPEKEPQPEPPSVDRNARLVLGTEVEPGKPDTADRGDGQQKGYIVLSDEERSKGFIRPVRLSYQHVGTPGPRFALRDLTPDELERFEHEYVKFEEYPESESPMTGCFWTQKDIDAIGKGCGVVTKMSQKIAETYARDPSFYGATFCIGCGTHLPVGERGQFVWDGTNERVGT